MAEKAIEQSRRYEAETRSKVAAANKHLRKKLRASGIEIEYLPDEDMLYVSFGAPRPSEALPLRDGTRAVMLFEPETRELTGLEAPFFMEDFERLEQKPAFWRFVADLIRARGNHVYIPPETETQQAQEALADLLGV